jgi:hypothetical protein
MSPLMKQLSIGQQAKRPHQKVEYGTTMAYGNSAAVSTLTASHNLKLSGLSAGTLYHFRVKSRDAAGNLATSIDFTLTTSAGPDTVAPTLNQVVASNVSSTEATVTWTTNELASSEVEYGPTTTYGTLAAVAG